MGIEYSQINTSSHENCNKRAYQFGKPLAFVEDLQVLHNLVLSWLMGDNDFGTHGYVPFNENGVIDKKYISFEFKDENDNSYDATSFKIYGDLVKVNFTSGRTFQVSVMEKISNNFYSDFGTNDNVTDSRMYLDQSFQKRLEKMICPIGGSVSQYGSPSAEHLMMDYCIHSNELQNDYISFNTKQQFFISDTTSSYFVISFLNANNFPIFIAQSQPVSGNQKNILMGDNRYCTMEIYDFSDHKKYYSANMKFNVDLKGYFKNISSKFKIIVSFINNNTITSWKSDQFFYCSGKKIPKETLTINASIDNSKPHSNVKAGGITYTTDGYIKFVVSGINYINNGAVLPSDENIVQFNSNILQQPYVFNMSDLNFNGNNRYNLEANNIFWEHSFKIKQNLLYPKSSISAYFKIKNVFDTTQTTFQNIQIQNNNEISYINTLPHNELYSTNSIQAFDGVIFKSSKSSYGNQDIATLEELIRTDTLQVIPYVGLCWPNYFDTYKENQNIRYFKRVFIGNQINKKLYYGGTILIGNFTQSNFFSEYFNLRISLINPSNNNRIWYNLKSYCGGQDNKGILGDVIQEGNELQINYVLPIKQYISSNTEQIQEYFQSDQIIQFQLSMKKGNSFKPITYIKFKNENNTQLL